MKDGSDQAWLDSLTKMDSKHEKLVNVISQLSDDMLEANVAGRDYSTRFLLHGIVRQHVYHAGQIALLRKAFVDE